MSQLAKLLIIVGTILLFAGLLLAGGDRLQWFGKLPGDFIIKKKNFTFYFPLATGLILSLLISLVLYLLSRWK